MPSSLGGKTPLERLNPEPSATPKGNRTSHCSFPTSPAGTWLELELSRLHGWGKICEQFSNMFGFVLQFLHNDKCP